jgi:aminoglycoside phosphotransferase family enzyme/predicted kinase
VSAGVAETPSAVLFFVGDRTYKLKKPVDLGFLDFTTRERREAACHREVALNRRLSPDVYLGVADVNGPDGTSCDHLVVMRRMPASTRLATLAREGHDLRGPLWTVAHQVATLHAASPRAGPRADLGRATTLRRHWSENLAVLREWTPSLRADIEPDRIDHLVDRYLRGRSLLLDERVDDGCVVDGHGDLRAEDIFVLPDGPRVLDCLDFSEELRWGDRLLDAAFLAMDLDDLGRPELAEAFLDWHRELTADTWPRSLAHHYVAYRAGVRAKVAAIKAGQVGDAVAPDIAHYCELTVRHLEAARVRAILVGGLPGTGKTSVARSVAERAGAVVLSSDEVRRELAVPVSGPTPGVDEGRYSPAARSAVYAELLGRARALLERGESVVLDASWSDASERRLARDMARATVTDVDELRCVAAPAIVEARIAARRARGTDASEATAEVARVMGTRFDDWPEATALDTDAPIGAVVDTALGALGLSPRGRVSGPGTPMPAPAGGR